MSIRSRGGRRGGRGAAAPLVLLCALGVLVAGCARSEPGTAHPQGAGPAATSPVPSIRAAPSTDAPATPGRPTVTVAPEPVPSGPTAGPTADPTPGPTSGPPSPPPATGGRPDGRPDGSSDGRPTAGTPGDRPAPSAPRGGATPGPPAPVGPLTADVVRDECLLDAAGFAALLDGPVDPPAPSTVTRPDGTRTRSCYAARTSGSSVAAVNVYRVNRGTPAAFVRAAAGGRPLPGIGDAAVLLDTVGGSALQVATPRYLVTISVVDGAPTAQRWTDAGRAAVAAAERR